MVSELEPNRPGDARKLECVRWWVDVRPAVSHGGLRLGRHPQSSYRRSPPMSVPLDVSGGRVGGAGSVWCDEEGAVTHQLRESGLKADP